MTGQPTWASEHSIGIGKDPVPNLIEAFFQEPFMGGSNPNASKTKEDKIIKGLIYVPRVLPNVLSGDNSSTLPGS